MSSITAIHKESANLSARWELNFHDWGNSKKTGLSNDHAEVHCSSAHQTAAEDYPTQSNFPVRQKQKRMRRRRRERTKAEPVGIPDEVEDCCQPWIDPVLAVDMEMTFLSHLKSFLTIGMEEHIALAPTCQINKNGL